jgi:cytosine/adenosine deaminase-related metal-dependent hydrolase
VLPRPFTFANLSILTADGVIGHTLRVKGRRIVAIDESPQRGDAIIDGRGGLLIPGLINAHDHLELNTFKRIKYRTRYTHSLQWIEDIEAHFETDPALVEPRRQPLADRLLIGGLKNLLCGVTTVCHHNPLYRALRRGYPIRVVKNYGFCHSLFRGKQPGKLYRRTSWRNPWLIHLAEGVDAVAAAEFDSLDQMGLVQPNTVLIHGVGLTAGQRQALAERGGGLIWCPASNDFMFGQTALVTGLAQAGKLALGSDSRLSGAFDLLAELRAADRTNQLSPQALFKTVTTDAARLLRLRSGGQGLIRVGGAADLVLLPPVGAVDPFAALLHIDRSRLELVLADGRPLVGAARLAEIFEATRTTACPVVVDGWPKLVPRPLVKRLRQAKVSESGLALDPA